MEKEKKFVSIGTKITIMTLIMVVVSIFSISVFSYYSYRSDSIKLQGDATMAAVNALAAALDAEKFKEVAETDEKNAYYWQMRELLDTARANTGVLYMYTMVKANDGVNFKYIHASSGSDYDSQGDLDPIESYGAPALTAYDTGISSVSGIYNNGEFGYMVSAFVPIIDLNGDVVGLICADKGADEVMYHLNNYKNRVILAAVLLTILFAVISAIYTKRSLGNPMRKLAELSEKIVEGKLDITLDIKHNDEIGLLGNSFLNIRDTLNRLALSLHKMSEIHLNGQLDYFVDSAQFTGAYQIVVNETNDMVREYVNNVWEMLSTLKGFGKGDFSIALREFPGQKSHANESIEILRSIFSGLSKEIGELAVSSAYGDLSKKIDTSKYEGDWRLLAEELNKLLEAIRNPISESVYVLGQMADGDFSEKVRGDYEGDFSLIKNSLNKTMHEISLYISEINNVLHKMSEQNLKVSIDREYIGDFGGIKASINMIIEKFNYVLGNINSSAALVALGARQISDLSGNLAHGSTEQASATEELNSSIEQIAVQADKNTRKANKANELVAEMRKSAETGNDEMKTMIVAMEEISESSTSISRIIKTIDDIAFQTNLLALNAAVEAARAGVHGKGFAVVAEEVRNLAGRSKVAAQETAVLIEDSIQKALYGVSISGGMATSLEGIVEQISEVSKLINEMAEASQEQCSSIHHINNGLMQISQVTQTNSTLSEESAAAAEELSSQAELFKNEIAKFKFKDA